MTARSIARLSTSAVLTDRALAAAVARLGLSGFEQETAQTTTQAKAKAQLAEQAFIGSFVPENQERARVKNLGCVASISGRRDLQFARSDALSLDVSVVCDFLAEQLSIHLKRQRL